MDFDDFCLFVCRGKPYVHITACTGFANLARLVDTITLCWDIHIIMVRICLLYLYIRQAFLIKELHRQFIHRRHLPRSPQIFLTWQNKKLQATRSLMLNPQKILQNRLGLPQLQQRFQKLTKIKDLHTLVSFAIPDCWGFFCLSLLLIFSEWFITCACWTPSCLLHFFCWELFIGMRSLEWRVKIRGHIRDVFI